MHYDIDYSGMEMQDKHDKAIQDIKDYLGEDRFEQITMILRNDEPLSYMAFKLALMMSGIQGYPLVAWHNHAYDLPVNSTKEL